MHRMYHNLSSSPKVSSFCCRTTGHVVGCGPCNGDDSSGCDSGSDEGSGCCLEATTSVPKWMRQRK